MAASSSSSNSEQQYSLRWNDFHSSILSSFRHLRDEEDFVDVTLACDSNSFTAHKVVLSACSPYFRRLLKANPCQHPIVILRDVASSDMESLLRFMYHGEVHVGQEQLAAFLKTAQMLQVRGLADVKSGTAGAKIPSGSETRDHTESPVTSRNTWHDRGDPSDSGLSPPPEKRSKSYSPPVGNHLEQLKGAAADLQESLLGQALEGGPTIHTPNNDIKAQSTGEDSNSASDNDEEMSNNDSILNSVKAEPNDILNDSLEHHRGTFPAALLGLQGLMPGPSGIHAANQDPNYDNRQRRKDGPPGPGGGGGGGRRVGGGVLTSTSAAASSTAHHHHDDRMLRVIKVEEIDVEEDYEDPVYPAGDSEDEKEEDEEDDEPKQMVTCSSISSTARQHQLTRVPNPQYQRPPLKRSQPQHHRRNLIQCPLCVRSYYDIADMRAHLDHHYPRDSPTCPVVSCAKTFSHPNSVRNHMRVKHAEQWDKIKTLRWTYV
ncbi:broad-complex core protein isoforms 1/2/3/4/5-like isoform X3 [Cotesia glomerata]|uniref:broad-complex core protein isoforms 1/2/3/4/5-like isoform X3 n=1 Tax=Cotesia glomerata TaxID=32391 RepID=UPI001D0274A1|nr:broad-complex core protein isoforms 1/2/3/4/5-like isoform X3 [Cotesia glomerata]